MTDVSMQHIHEDIESLKQEVSLIRHILSQEGQLTEEAKNRLAIARQTPKSEYAEL